MELSSSTLNWKYHFSTNLNPLDLLRSLFSLPLSPDRPLSFCGREVKRDRRHNLSAVQFRNIPIDFHADTHIRLSRLDPHFRKQNILQWVRPDLRRLRRTHRLIFSYRSTLSPSSSIPKFSPLNPRFAPHLIVLIVSKHRRLAMSPQPAVRQPETTAAPHPDLVKRQVQANLVGYSYDGLDCTNLHVSSKPFRDVVNNRE